MTVSTEQWAAAAVDAGMSMDELRAKIAEIDDGHADRDLRPMHFDRQGDPLTLGEWAFLYEWGRSYRFLRSTILPNRYLIASIWTGTDEDMEEPPVVMRTGVFYLRPDRDAFPPTCYEVLHLTEEDAFEAHDWLVGLYSLAEPPSRARLERGRP